MTAWSRSEAVRTIDEVKQRSRVDSAFRALALADPKAALIKVNPRPAPSGTVRFVGSGAAEQEIWTADMIVAILPESLEEKALTLEELEEVAGGNNPPPPVGIS